MPVEVAPIAHYHMGGVQDRHRRWKRGCRTSSRRAKSVAGANGANRLSGNAITEALVFGRDRRCNPPPRVRKTCRNLRGRARWPIGTAAVRSPRSARPPQPNLAGIIAQMQSVMADYVGPFRSQRRLWSTRCERNHVAEISISALLPPEAPGNYSLERARLVRPARRCCWWRRPSHALRCCAPRAAALIKERTFPVYGRQLGASPDGGLAWTTSFSSAARRSMRQSGTGGRLMGVTATLLVRRGEAGGPKSVTTRYEVPYSHGQSVLDGLRYVRGQYRSDPEHPLLACINANTCKECMIDGRRQDRLRLHGPAGAARDDHSSRSPTRRICATSSPKSPRRMSGSTGDGCATTRPQRRRRAGGNSDPCPLAQQSALDRSGRSSPGRRSAVARAGTLTSTISSCPACCMPRSCEARSRMAGIVSIDVAAAEALPGVHRVLTLSPTCVRYSPMRPDRAGYAVGGDPLRCRSLRAGARRGMPCRRSDRDRYCR